MSNIPILRLCIRESPRRVDGEVDWRPTERPALSCHSGQPFLAGSGRWIRPSRTSAKADEHA